MTVKELQQHIREATQQVNQRIEEYRIGQKNARYPYSDEVFEKGIKELQRTSGQKEKGDVVKTLLRGKRKKELERQLKRLDRFLDSLDTVTDTAVEKAEANVQARYDSYMNNPDNPSLTLDEYRDLMDDLGTIGTDVLGTFNYQAMMEEYADLLETGKSIDLVKAVRNVRSDEASKGVTRDRFTELVIEEMRKQINN